MTLVIGDRPRELDIERRVQAPVGLGGCGAADLLDEVRNPLELGDVLGERGLSASRVVRDDLACEQGRGIVDVHRVRRRTHGAERRLACSQPHPGVKPLTFPRLLLRLRERRCCQRERVEVGPAPERGRRGACFAGTGIDLGRFVVQLGRPRVRHVGLLPETSTKSGEKREVVLGRRDGLRVAGLGGRGGAVVKLLGALGDIRRDLPLEPDRADRRLEHLAVELLSLVLEFGSGRVDGFGLSAELVRLVDPVLFEFALAGICLQTAGLRLVRVV